MFYHLSDEFIFVIAVLDLRQDPAAFESRLDSD